jgi:hypothetical protein
MRQSPQVGQLGLLPFERKETVMRGLSSESVVRLSVLLAWAAGLWGVALGQPPGTRPGSDREDEVEFPTPPDGPEPPVRVEYRLFLDPIPGLTQGRHLAPASFAVPLGSHVWFFQEARPEDEIIWEGADVQSADETGQIAVCPMTRAGRQSIRVQVLNASGEVFERGCDVQVLDVPIEGVKLAGIALDKVHLGLTEQSTNEETMDHFFGPPVSGVRMVARNRYRTSIHRLLTFHPAKLRPRAISSITEWRVDGDPVRLGPTLHHSFIRPGVHRVSVGPVARPAEIEVETYIARITSHVSRRDIVPEGVPITFTAVTDPPGFEDEITWLSSTKYGTATPVLGSGPTFTVQFNNTWGPHPDGDLWQWLGVKADNAILNQDQKEPPCNVAIKQCLQVCKDATMTFRSNASPPGGGYAWEIKEGADKATIVGAANAQNVAVKGTAVGAVKLSVTYTTPKGQTCRAICDFNVVDCPNCNCYFSFTECEKFGLGNRCNRGEKDTWQDNCKWMKPKLRLTWQQDGNNCDNTPGNETPDCCSERQDVYDNPCDGICQSNLLGSACGSEDATSLSTAFYLWADAIVEAAARGGGMVHPIVAALARDELATDECAELLGREVGNEILGFTGADVFQHPDDLHEFHDHVIADMSSYPCLIEGLRVLVEAYAAELREPGAAEGFLNGLPYLCSGALDFVIPCELGDALSCVKARVREFYIYMRTPRQGQ